MSNAKGDVVDELVVVEIKLVWQNILLDWEVRLSNAEVPSRPFSLSSVHPFTNTGIDYLRIPIVLCQGSLQSLLTQ